MKGKTMNQTIKDEIKAITVAARIEKGIAVCEKVMQLPQKIDEQLQRFYELKASEVADPYLMLTEILPDEIGYEFLEATEIYKNSDSGKYIESRKMSIDKDFIEKIDEINDLEDEYSADERLDLAQVHIKMFAYKYQSLGKEIVEAIK